MAEHSNEPVIYYSSVRYQLSILTAVVVAVIALVYSLISGKLIALVPAFFCLIFAFLFGRAVRNKMQPGAIALARDGNLLVGNELTQPLPINETSFKIKSDNQGSWVILLYSGDSKITLAAGGWKMQGQRFMTKSVTEHALLDLGLKKTVQ